LGSTSPSSFFLPHTFPHNCHQCSAFLAAGFRLPICSLCVVSECLTRSLPRVLTGFSPFFYSQLISQSAQCSSALLRCCLRFEPAPFDSAVIPARSCRSPRPLRFSFVNFWRRSSCACRSGGRLQLPYMHQALVLPQDFSIRLLQGLCVLLCALLDFRFRSSVFGL
jgi:hypothetical protein